MKLQHKALRHFISVSVIVLTSTFLVYELVASDRAMSAYMRYIIEKADSSFLYDKYTNQSIAAHLMRRFSSPKESISPEQRKALCNAFESVNGTHGLNLTNHNYLPLRGTLQTHSGNCVEQLDDIFLLPAFDQAVNVNRELVDYGQGLGTVTWEYLLRGNLLQHTVFPVCC